ncbi:hypothetical protein RND81_10G197200 [Saponaria officinalis]|uniref:Pentatricopeptide repeat-containing protein n=1 Tax=Saponaria officinalis TaxID=3572 RepID=A0AAW1I4E7_SAPOF
MRLSSALLRKALTNTISSSYAPPLLHILSHSTNNQIIAPTNFYREFHITTGKIENPNSSSLINEIHNDSQKICKVLTTLPKNASFDSVLQNCGVEVTPILVLEALKKLSNAGVLALGFFKWAEKQKGFQHTTESYNALIDSLGKIKQFKMIWVLVDSMKSKGILTKCTFNLIIRRYARAKKVDDAVRTFDKMEQYGMKLELSDFNRFLDTLCKSRQVEKAHQVFDKMKTRRFRPDQKSYTILLEGWGQQQNLLRLDEVYWEMKADGFDPDVVAYGIIMNAYCKAGKVDRALEKFNEMEVKGIEPSPHIYCILINGLGSEKRLGEALKFHEMSKAGGVMPEVPTYNAVVGSYCWSMRFEEAFRVVDEMRRCGVGPNSRTYDIILHHLVGAGRYKEAYLTFRKMGDDQGCDPTLSTYEIILRMFCNNGELNMAIQVWEQMEAKGVLPGMHLFATMINSFRHANKLEVSIKYFDKMMDMGIRPPASVFGNLKQALLQQGKKDIVVALTKKLDAIRTTPVKD